MQYRTSSEPPSVPHFGRSESDPRPMSLGRGWSPRAEAREPLLVGQVLRNNCDSLGLKNPSAARLYVRDVVVGVAW
jgi:hypothetical protein